MRRIWLLVTTAALLLAPQAWARKLPWPTETLSIAVDGELWGLLNTPRIDGVTCLSLKTTRKVFGGKVSWKRVSRQFVYTNDTRSAEFRLDSPAATVGGKNIALETDVRSWGDDAYLPISLFSTPEFQSVVGSRVVWDPGHRTLSVDTIPSVSSPRAFSYPTQSKIVFELGPRVEYRVLSQRKGSIVIRLFNGQAKEWERLEIKDGVVGDVEVSPRSHTTDITITLEAAAGASEVKLAEDRTLAIVIDRTYGAPPASAAANETPDIPDGTIVPAPPEAILSASPPEKMRPASGSPYLSLSPIKTIVVDAGHGGKDTGAVGPHGTLEKNINLQIALALAKLLKSERRFHVILTRADDHFVTLADRSSIANKNKADLFISIHCNAGLARKSSGFEIYYLSEHASDDDAAAVARRENSVVEMEGMMGKGREKVEELLWSLARNEHMNDSSEVAAHMARQVGQRLSVPNRGVKQAGFYVLRGTSMPAVLVESAFITHPKEEGLLRSTRYHQKLVDALYAGLLEYEKRKIQVRLKESAGGT